MKNRTISRIFEEIADFLEIKGENPFKIRSYKNVAKTISSFPQPIEKYVKEGGDLEKIKGVGEAIKKKIMEILDTGDCNLHRRLLGEMPYTLLSLLRIPKLGPKTVGILYSSYGIKNVEELVEFMNSERAKEIPKFGKKKRENILKSTEKMKPYLGKFTIEEAEEAVSLALEEIEGSEPVGSFRRWDEIYDDVDIIFFGKPLKLPWQRIVTKEKTRFLFPLGIPVDFFEKRRRGIWKLFLTGPPHHIEFLKKRAKKIGGELRYDGLFINGKAFYKTEEEIYSALSLPWIPPEIRHKNPEEVPPLIDTGMMKGDLHLHTDWTDGKDTLERMIRKASSLGYSYIGISDHSFSSRIANGLSEERILEQIETIRKSSYPIKTFAGSEVDILEDGRLDYSDLVLSKLDYVIASSHIKLDMGREEMTRRVLRAMENPYVVILGHPTGRLIGKRPPAEIDWNKIFKKAEEKKIAIEINCQPQRLDLPYWLIEKAKKYKIYFIISTDAHSASSLESLRRYGIMVARKTALSPHRIVNTWELEKFEAFLRKRGEFEAPEY